MFPVVFKRIFSLILLSVLSSMLYANGQTDETAALPEYSIRDARELIDAKDYNQAMAILVQIVREDPEQMELAQRLILEIRESRDLYNQKYEELMDVLFVQEDYEQSLALIKELEALDPNPNDATMDSLRDARISAELVYNRSVFTQIMDQALVFLDTERYYQAIQLYRTGFTLSKRTFDETPYDILIKEPVYRGMEETEGLLTGLETSWDSFLEQTSAFLNTAAAAEDEGTALTEEIDNLSRLISLRNEIFENAKTLNRQNQLVQQSAEDGIEDFYLTFMELLMTGRLSVDQREGIVSALDFYINQNFGELADYYTEEIRNLTVLADRAYGLENWTEALRLYGERTRIALQWDDLLSLNRDRIYLDEDYSLERLARSISDRFYPLYIENIYFLNQSQLQEQLALAELEYEENRNAFEEGTVEDLWSFRDIVKSPLDPMQEKLNRLVAFSDQRAQDPLLVNDWSLEPDDSISRFNSLENQLLQLDSELVLALADTDLEPLKNLLEEYNNRLTLNRSYIEGFEQEDTDVQVLTRFPERALNDMALLDEQYNDLESDLQEFRQTFNDTLSSLSDQGALEERIAEAENAASRLNIAQLEMDDLETTGEDFIYRAQENLNQGNFRFNSAETALNRSNFEQAKNALSQAQQLYVTALSFNEDVSSRENLDQRVADLQARILDEENKQVIRDVRQLINEARGDYFQGLYLRAEASLVQAQNRWASTNVDENDEVQYWLNLVRAALSVESGRTVEETDPLFQDITQLFNLAYNSFLKGKDLLESGDKVGGIRALNQSDNYLNQILIPLPINQDARVLKLKIQQLIDVDIFNETFREIYQGARTKVLSDTDLDEAYLDLKDLDSLNPDYPGLAATILEAEYKLGIKARPPNPADLRESENLYRQALAVQQAGNVLFYPTAIQQLDEAIALNPQNNRAIALKDEMSIYGSEAPKPLPSQIMATYRQAEEAFVNREYFRALQLMNPLINDEEYRRNPQIISLWEKINANMP